MPRVNAAVRIASAAGVSRPEMMARSDERSTGDPARRWRSAPPGRSPLLNGIPGRERHQPADHSAGRLYVTTAGPSRGSTSRDSSSQHASPQIQVGQPHPDTGVAGSASSVRAGCRTSRTGPPGCRTSGSEVGHVAGVVGHPGHAEDVPVVAGVRPDDVPDRERPMTQPSTSVKVRHHWSGSAAAPGGRRAGPCATAPAVRRRSTPSPAASPPASAGSEWWRTGCRWWPGATVQQGQTGQPVNTPTIAGRRLGSLNPLRLRAAVRLGQTDERGERAVLVDVISMR